MVVIKTYHLLAVSADYNPKLKGYPIPTIPEVCTSIGWLDLVIGLSAEIVVDNAFRCSRMIHWDWPHLTFGLGLVKVGHPCILNVSYLIQHY